MTVERIRDGVVIVASGVVAVSILAGLLLFFAEKCSTPAMHACCARPAAEAAK